MLESLDSVLESSGPEVAAEILERPRAHATVNGIDLPFSAKYSLREYDSRALAPLFSRRTRNWSAASRA